MSSNARVDKHRLTRQKPAKPQERKRANGIVDQLHYHESKADQKVRFKARLEKKRNKRNSRISGTCEESEKAKADLRWADEVLKAQLRVEVEATREVVAHYQSGYRVDFGGSLTRNETASEGRSGPFLTTNPSTISRSLESDQSNDGIDQVMDTCDWERTMRDYHGGVSKSADVEDSTTMDMSDHSDDGGSNMSVEDSDEES